MAITKDKMLDGFRALGLRAGDSVLVHSSLSSFGRVEGGADAVIDAVIAAVDPGGTVLFPTLTGSSEFSSDDPPRFNVLSTPSWTGKIPETARHRPGFVRSCHPTHSLCAFGSRTEWFVEGHENAPTPCGIGTPYDKLAASGGYILLIGVTHQSNTTMHYVEELAGVPWHIQDGTALSTIEYADGRIETVPVRLHKYGTPRDFTRLEPEMLERGIQINGLIGESTVRLVKARELVDLVLARVKEDPTILLPAV